MASFRIGYASGNTLVRDHIYNPRITTTQWNSLYSSVFDGAWTPEIDLASVMALHWRVKKWKFVSGSGALHSVGTGPSGTAVADLTFSLANYPTLYAPLQYYNGAFVDATDERLIIHNAFGPAGFGDIVEPLGYTGLTNAGFSLVGGNAIPITYAQVVSFNGGTPAHTSGTTTVGTGFSLNLLSQQSIGTIRNYYVIWNGNFRVFCDLEVDGPDISGPPNIKLSVFPQPPAPATDLSAKLGTLTFDPLIVPVISMPFRCRYDFDGYNTSVILTGGFNISFIAEEFWPYQNRHGQPVYDSINGSIINNPFS